MFEKIKAKLVFDNLLKRPNIDNAYKMVGPEDSWYDTISCVHRSLAEIQNLPHETLEIESLDGLKLRGIYYPAAEPSKKTVIAIHGYTSHPCKWITTLVPPYLPCILFVGPHLCAQHPET